MGGAQNKTPAKRILTGLPNEAFERLIWQKVASSTSKAR
jgi:hypothetical protein